MEMWPLIISVLLATSNCPPTDPTITNPCTKNESTITWEFLPWPPPVFTEGIPASPIEDSTIFGATKSKLDVIIMGDGFRDTTEDRELFIAKCDEAINHIASTVPYRRCAFNFYRIFVESLEDTLDHPLASPPVCRCTALNLGFGYDFGGGDTYAKEILHTQTQERVWDLANETGFDFDFIVVLGNSRTYGGASYWKDGWPIVTTSIGLGFESVLTHEIAHELAHLADEYDDQAEPFGDSAYDTSKGDPAANVTIETDRASIKWNDLIKDDTPIPTTLDVLDELPWWVVGLWPGADGFDRDIYRPQLHCLMRDSKTPRSFCAVCEAELKNRMSFRCKGDFMDVVPEPWPGSTTMPCIKGRAVRVPLPPCLGCRDSKLSQPGGGWIDADVDSVDIELGPFPPGTTIDVLDDTGRVIGRGVPSPSDMIRIFFESHPFRNYYLEIIFGTCDSDAISITARIHLNGRETTFR